MSSPIVIDYGQDDAGNVNKQKFVVTYFNEIGKLVRLDVDSIFGDYESAVDVRWQTGKEIEWCCPKPSFAM